MVERLLYQDPPRGNLCRGPEEIPFYKQQRRTVLKACGKIDPDDIRQYIHDGGYAAARKAYRDLTPGADLRGDDPLRAARPGRRRFSDGPKMGADPASTGRKEIRHLQRRRRRSRRLHGSQRDGGQSAQRHGRHDDRRPGHRRRRGLRLRAGRISAGRAAHPQRGYGGREVGPAGRPFVRHRAELPHPRDGRRRGVRLRRGDGLDGLDRRQARHAASQAAVSRPKRPVGHAHGDQQRRDAGHRAARAPARARPPSGSSAPRSRRARRPSP